MSDHRWLLPSHKYLVVSIGAVEYGDKYKCELFSALTLTSELGKKDFRHGGRTRGNFAHPLGSHGCEEENHRLIQKFP